MQTPVNAIWYARISLSDKGKIKINEFVMAGLVGPCDYSEIF
jgi:hypothetical protein